MDRRQFLESSLFGLGAGCTPPRRESTAVQDAPVPSLPEMARAVLAADRDEVHDLALGWADRGASPRTLLGAAYLAGLAEINPSPIGGQVHAMMMVASAAETTALLPARHRLLPALFNLDRTKRSQQRDAGSGRGDWQMPAPPDTEPLPRAEAEAALTDALRDWDLAAADRAGTRLHQATSLPDFFETLWRWAARDFRIIGHKIIFATQSYRALHEIGWRHGRDAVRAVLFGILDQNPYDAFDRETSTAILSCGDRNWEHAAGLAPGWEHGTHDGEACQMLFRELRSRDAEASADAVLAHLAAGHGAASAWDAVRLRAFELVAQNPHIAGIHPVTSVNALHRAALYTTQPASKAYMLLQAASYQPMFLPIFAERRRAKNDVQIEALVEGSQRGDPFAETDPFAAAPRAAAALREGDPARFAARAAEVLARKAQHDHDYKFTVAAVEEIGAAHPAVRPLLGAAAMFFLRTERSRDNAVFERLRG